MEVFWGTDNDVHRDDKTLTYQPVAHDRCFQLIGILNKLPRAALLKPQVTDKLLSAFLLLCEVASSGIECNKKH